MRYLGNSDNWDEAMLMYIVAMILFLIMGYYLSFHVSVIAFSLGWWSGELWPLWKRLVGVR